MNRSAFHEIAINGSESILLTTNVPPAVALFDPEISEGPRKIDEQWELGYAFNPDALDQLEPGTYTVRTRLKTGWLPLKQCVTQSIDLMPSEHGMVVGVDSFGRAPFPSTVRSTNRLVAPLMSLIGYTHDAQKDITGIPTPLTVQKAVAPWVPVQLYPGKGDIDAYTYVDSFAAGKFPVATGEQRPFIHDICDDHLTSMILGGKPLMAALQETAASHLADGKVGEAAQAIDSYTLYMRSAVIEDEHSEGEGNSSLHRAGRRLRTPPHVTDNIIEAGRERAHLLEIPVTVSGM